jgi:UDP-2-acetamido-3-amino-2,3-dideoxy-glucuronate N-acetyltransferase
MNCKIHPSAFVDDGASLGEGCQVWHFCHVMPGATLGKGCILGQNVMIAPGVHIGNNVKIQNNVSVYEGVVLEDDVFCGPSCVFTNVINPRSQIVRRGQYQSTLVRRGATLGANSTIVCGSTLGQYCFIAAGAVVKGEIPDYALMAGVPARQKGWMSRHGYRLKAHGDGWICPESGWRYELRDGQMRCLELAEDQPLNPK